MCSSLRNDAGVDIDGHYSSDIAPIFIIRKENVDMDEKSYTYYCPKSGTCPIGKHCHVLTTAVELTTEIFVRQKCLANGRTEILIVIGKAL